MTATCIVRRSLLGNEQLSVQVVQARKHHHVSGDESELKAAVTTTSCAAVYACVSLNLVAAIHGRRKGDRRGLRL